MNIVIGGFLTAYYTKTADSRASQKNAIGMRHKAIGSSYGLANAFPITTCHAGFGIMSALPRAAFPPVGRGNLKATASRKSLGAPDLAADYTKSHPRGIDFGIIGI